MRLPLTGVLILLALGLPAPGLGAAAPFTLTLTATAGGSANVAPSQATYGAGAIVTLAATPEPGRIFIGRTIAGADGGWVTPRKLVMDRDHQVVALFAPTVAFTGQAELNAWGSGEGAHRAWVPSAPPLSGAYG